MPRKKTIRTNEFPYHVVSRTNQRNWFQIPMKEVWKLAMSALNIANNKHPVNIHAFVLMSNHYHLVVDTPDSNIDKFMYEFNKNFSLTLRISSRLQNKMFGGRYKWSLLTSKSYYMNVLKYVFRNPIKANICSIVEDYPFSSLRKFPLNLCPYIDPGEFLEWFNEAHDEKQNESIKKGLRNSNFSYCASREDRIPPDYDIPDNVDIFPSAEDRCTLKI